MEKGKAKAQIRSKQRVEEHGEVFTAKREVNAMLDLVKAETERIESRFLEPACGDGNFLVEVLNRKLSVVIQKYGKIQLEYERHLFLAISSLYGIDLMSDNVKECQNRLAQIAETQYKAKFKSQTRKAVVDSIQFVLSKNIVCGDALSMTSDKHEPIVFPEWSLVTGSKVKRRDFAFDSLVNTATNEPTFDMVEHMDTDSMGKIIPTPIKDYSIVDFTKVSANE
ncbi:SAM-dependent DNA methyltransferase [Bifidobacterium sp. ESL0784]|uniref:DNA methyltransferase n=1 Tax=Bifidobacterium sp. ESL0784 TaxID=2983231 RepID=UPI0023F7DC8B|nr:DNA methyltransferase [Bifidobacterium sp. ESL0784]MDF7641313.1 SAM-dependent DNA methyltransferase [Bifidobacterium sp. ESL0784]